MHLVVKIGDEVKVIPISPPEGKIWYDRDWHVAKIIKSGNFVSFYSEKTWHLSLIMCEININRCLI